MIKPTIALLVFVTLFSSLLSSSMAATLPVEADSSRHAAHPPLAPSLRFRKAAAAAAAAETEVPHQERKLTQQLGPFCFAFDTGGMPSPVPCNVLSCSDPACVADEDTATRDGNALCSSTRGFMVAKPNLEQCVWTYACCY